MLADGLVLAAEPVTDEIAADDVVDDDGGVDSAVNDDDFVQVHRVNEIVHLRRAHDSSHADAVIHANTLGAPLGYDFPILHGPAFVLEFVCTV